MMSGGRENDERGKQLVVVSSASLDSSPAAAAEASHIYCAYPPPLAKYEDVARDPKLFMETLVKLHEIMGTKFMSVSWIYLYFFWTSSWFTLMWVRIHWIGFSGILIEYIMCVFIACDLLQILHCVRLTNIENHNICWSDFYVISRFHWKRKWCLRWRMNYMRWKGRRNNGVKGRKGKIWKWEGSFKIPNISLSGSFIFN